MTEHELFQKTFSTLHASPDTLMEVQKTMENSKKTHRTLRRGAVIAIAAALPLTVAAAAGVVTLINANVSPADKVDDTTPHAFTAAIAAGADLQRLGCLHHKGLVVAARAVGRHYCRRCLQWTGVSGILAMVLIDRRRHRPGTEGGRSFFLIPNAPCLCGMLGTKTGCPHHAGRVSVVFRPERCCAILRHIHTAAALVV